MIKFTCNLIEISVLNLKMAATCNVNYNHLCLSAICFIPPGFLYINLNLNFGSNNQIMKKVNPLL